MVPEYDLDFNKIKDFTYETPEDGLYVLQNTDIIKEEDSQYGTKYVCTHAIVGMNKKINFDNYKLFTPNGEPEAFGQSKLKSLLIATKLDKIGKISIKILQPALKDKMFKAYVEFNDKGFGRIRYAEIYPMNFPERALNEIITDAPDTATQPEVSPQDFEDDEI